MQNHSKKHKESKHLWSSSQTPKWGDNFRHTKTQTNIWKEHLDAHWDHRHTTHTLWKIIHGLSIRAPPHTRIQHHTHYISGPRGYKKSKNNNSQGPDKLNIRHLKHIGPLGLAFLTSMFKTALNKNIIPDTWKLANIVHIPKPNKDTDKGTSYRPISLLTVIANTLEKSLLPYITANIANTPMHHGYKTQHSTVTALHTLNNIVAKGFNQMVPPARTITVALDMSKAFDTI